MNMLLLNTEVQSFLRSQDERSSHEVALKPSPFVGISSSELAQQVAARSKARTKLPILYDLQGIVYPKGISVEQCSSEATALYKADIIGKGVVGADITGGFGVDAMFVSRGFDSFDYFEIDDELCEIAENNFAVLGCRNINVCCADGATSVLSSDKHYDVIFADPARRDANASRVYSIEDCTPDIGSIRKKLLDRCDSLVVKLSPMLDISWAIDTFECVSRIHVVAHRNEVKELLFVLNKDTDKQTRVTVCDIASDGHRNIFTGEIGGFTQQTQFSIPLKYIYDPSAAMRKSSLSDAYAHSVGLGKIGRETMLYTSDDLIEGFQGRVFEVVGELDKKNVKQLIPSQKANVISKNYPLSASELSRKLKLKDGGEDFVVAFGDLEQKKRVLVCRKVGSGV